LIYKGRNNNNSSIGKGGTLAEKGVSQSQVERMVEDLKVKQNQEMLQILKEEEEKEAQRGEQLSKISNGEEKKRLEKIFGIERAKAQSKIEQLWA
jgi:hypothetical protein